MRADDLQLGSGRARQAAARKEYQSCGRPSRGLPEAELEVSNARARPRVAASHVDFGAALKAAG